jgi:hypothetical protein
MRFLCVLSVVCVLSISAAALDREAFTFTKYDLDSRIEPEQQRLGVRGKITLRNDSEIPQKNVSLQISSSLNWSSIQFENKPVNFQSQTYTTDIDHTGALTEAIVTFPKPVAPKQTVELEIGYEGVIPQDATRLTRIGVPAEDARHSDWDQIRSSFTAVRGIGYVMWYPVSLEAANLSDPSSISEAVGRWKEREAQTEMKVRFAQSGGASSILPQLYCNGHGLATSAERMGRNYDAQVLCSYENLSATVPVFVIGNLSAIDKPSANISYAAEDKSGAEDLALAIEEAVPFIDARLGDHRALRESKVEVIELPDPQASPFESGNLLLMPLNGNDTQLLLSAVQQLAHLRFSSGRSWIRDGLARYAQVRFIQEKEGRPGALSYLEGHRKALADLEKDAAVRNDQASNSLINSTDEFYVQTKAMNVWWMLRDMAGENALTAALHNYKADDDTSPFYIRKLIEAQAHRDLEWFFDDWVYRDRGLPDFHIASVYPRELVNGGYMVTVTVENLGSAGAEVPVTLRMEHNEATLRLTVPAKSQASIRIPAASLPREVIVNDGSVPETDTTNNTFRIESLNR